MLAKAATVTGTQLRSYCTTSFLKNVEVVQSINQKLEEIQHPGTQWWDTGVAIIRSEALRFHAREPKQPKAGEAKILSLLLKSSAQKVQDPGLFSTRISWIHPNLA